MAVAPEDVEAVLEFLRKYGFTEAESALREDINERTQLVTFDFEKFLFPMHPPAGIPANITPPYSAGVSDYNGSMSVGGGASSDDEFVSLGSPTTKLCSSEFENPNGEDCSSSRMDDSDASSDRLSQYGTARTHSEWSEIYCQNDNIENEYGLMSPEFKESDFFICPADDKFIMSSESDNPIQDRLSEYVKSEGFETEADVASYLDKPCPVNILCKSEEDYHVFDKCIEAPSENHCENSPGKDDVGIIDYEKKGGGADEEVDDDDDGLLMIGSYEDEYEVFDLRIIHRKNRTGFEESKDLPIVLNTIIGGRYCITEYLGSAAFSKVVQAHDLCNQTDVCLKIIKNDKDFFDQSLDEIKLLKHVNKHDPADEHHILRLYDYFYHQEHLFIVCELLRANLYEFQKFNQESGGDPYFTMYRLQVITHQCLDALVYLHGLRIIHCDLKPENILIKSYKRCEIKIIDLGSSCFCTDDLSLYVQSRSYRAPEVILGLSYEEKIDLWSLGCILAELSSGEVLFPNEAMAMILSRMVGILGPIDSEMLEKGQETYKYFTKEYDLYHVNEEGSVEYIVEEEQYTLEERLGVSDALFIDFVRSLLEINPLRRPTASQALLHPWLSASY